METELKEEMEPDERYGRGLKRLELLEELTVESVRKFARVNYEHGGDIIEECLSDEEVEELIRKGKEEILFFLELQYSVRRDIESTIW